MSIVNFSHDELHDFENDHYYRTNIRMRRHFLAQVYQELSYLDKFQTY